MTMLQASLRRDLVDAAGKGDLEHVRRLLDLGVSTSAPGPRGWHALHMAAMYGREAVVRELLARGFPVDLPNRIGSTALAEAVHQIGELAWRARGLPVHVEVGEDDGEPGSTAEERLYRIVHQLLAAGANPRAGRSPEGAPFALAEQYEVDKLRAIFLPYGHWPYVHI